MIARSIRQQSLLNAFWIPLNFQNTAILTIAVPAALLHIAGRNHTTVLAVVASAIAALAMVVPPVAGAISDRLRHRGGLRRPFILVGAAVNVVGLVWLARANELDLFVAALLVATLGQSVSLAAYQPLIPEVVDRSQWGLASGYQGIASLLGCVLGFALASFMAPAAIFWWSAAFIVAGAITVAAINERRFAGDGDHAHVGSWYNFIVAFVSRMLVFFGLILLMTFVLYFFHDVLKDKNPSASTGAFGALALAGAVATSLWMGHLSDRISRKGIVAAAGIPMAAAISIFALAPSMRSIAAIALLFGLGYGAFVSTGWALGLDSVPKLRDAARDLGTWGIAVGLPGILAPAFGGWLLAQYANPAAAYRMLFLIAAGCLGFASVVVLFIRENGRTSPGDHSPNAGSEVVSATRSPSLPVEETSTVSGP